MLIASLHQSLGLTTSTPIAKASAADVLPLLMLQGDALRMPPSRQWGEIFCTENHPFCTETRCREGPPPRATSATTRAHSGETMRQTITGFKESVLTKQPLPLTSVAHKERCHSHCIRSLVRKEVAATVRSNRFSSRSGSLISYNVLRAVTLHFQNSSHKRNRDNAKDGLFLTIAAVWMLVGQRAHQPLHGTFVG